LCLENVLEGKCFFGFFERIILKKEIFLVWRGFDLNFTFVNMISGSGLGLPDILGSGSAKPAPDPTRCHPYA
jgi:hypothetical protein